MSGTRVVLADDDVLLREGLATLLERHGFEVVGQAGDGGALLDLVHRLEPDVAVVDVRMPPTHTTEGLQAAHEIRRAIPALGILVLSAHAAIDEALDLLTERDGIGYLLKSRIIDANDFVAALQRVAAGGSAIDPALVRELVVRQRRSDPLDALTEREREVLALMAEGRSNAGIARRLWLAEGTVEKHVKSILGKLGIHATDDDNRRVLAVVTFLQER
jgi:DNA-binding NarL/FixJ family response regulator